MLPLAHLGIGTAVGRCFVAQKWLPFLTLGIFLPDLIDKPIIYLKTGMLSAPNMGTFYGHSLGLLCLLFFISAIMRSGAPVAIAVGMITHLGLDAMGGAFEMGYLSFQTLAENIWYSSGVSYHDVSDDKHSQATFFFEGVGFLLILLQVFFFNFARLGRVSVGTSDRGQRRRLYSPMYRRRSRT